MIERSIKGINYGLGLAWSRVITPSIALERHRIAKEKGYKCAVTLSYEEDSHMLGYAPEAVKNVVSGAAVLSCLEPNMLLVESLGDDRYWLCVIYDNEVLAGYDLVCSASEAVLKIDGFMEQWVGSEDDLLIAISQQVLSVLNLELAGSKDITFSDILDSYSDILPAAISKSKIKRIYDLKTVALAVTAAIAVGVLGCVFAVGFGDDDYEDDAAWAPKPVTVPAKPHIFIPAGPTKSELLLKAKKEEESWVRNDFNRLDNPKVVTGFSQFVGSLSLSTAGWDVKSISFDALKPDEISVYYEKSVLGTVLTLKTKLSDRTISLKFNDDGSACVAKYAFNGKPVGEPLVSPKSDIKAFIAKNTYKRLEWMHDLDLLGYNWSEAVGSLGKRPLPIKDVPSDVTNKRQLKNTVYELSASSSDMFMLKDLSALFLKAKTTIIGSMTVNVSDASIAGWTMKGLIYEN